MTVRELHSRAAEMIAQGYEDDEVFLDTDGDGLYRIDQLDLEVDEDKVIIWGEREY